MTHPTHGLDPNALEAALSVKLVGQFWPGETAIESEDHNWSAYRAERYAQIITAYRAALSQNPGTSNTSGEAVVWRGHEIPIRCPYPEYGRAGAPIAYDIDPGQGSATNRLVRDWPHEEYIDHLRISDGEITPLFAALEPRASDRARTIEECAKVADGVRQRLEAGRNGKPLSQIDEHTAGTGDRIAAAIRKLSEVSHE